MSLDSLLQANQRNYQGKATAVHGLLSLSLLLLLQHSFLERSSKPVN